MALCNYLLYCALAIFFIIIVTTKTTTTTIIIITRNKSNASFEALQYRQDLFAIAHYYNRKNFPSYTCCSENHNNMCTENRKIRGLRFKYSVVRHREKCEHGCTTTYKVNSMRDNFCSIFDARCPSCCQPMPKISRVPNQTANVFIIIYICNVFLTFLKWFQIQ